MYYSNELYHHGIKGQKWGVRRYQNSDGTYTSAGRRRYEIGEAKAALKGAKSELRRVQAANRSTGILAGRGVKRENDLRERRIQKAENKVYDAKAALGKARGGEKGELKAYTKMMRKTGLSGSVKDMQTNGKGTKLYDHIATKKGKDYAQKIENRAKKQLVAQVIGGTAVAVGAQVLSYYLEERNYG